MRPPYVELRCRSAFSFLDGATLPEDLMGTAAALGCDALALGDRDGLYGAPRFFRAARKTGVRPLVGAEITLAAGPDRLRPPPLLLLVEDRRGYKNLCRLLTRMKEGRLKGEGEATHELLEEHAGGMVGLAGATPRPDLDRLAGIFGPRSLYVELQRHLDDAEAHRNLVALAQAQALRLPVVATNDVRFARPTDRRVHDLLTCTRHKTTVDAVGRRLRQNAERHLKPPAELAALFRDRPDAVHATRAIADRCAFTLADLGYQFPHYPAPDGQSEQSFLEKMTWLGAAGRYQPIGARERRQLEHELAIIGKLGLAGYFLVVWDIVRFARERGIMAQGRGSAANSATCYALGITAVDPVGMDLLFERFLSEERVSSASDASDRMPDIDLDLPSGDRREEVIQHVYRSYGPHGAAMTANVITYRPRMAVRDAGRALGFSEEQLNRIARHLPHWIDDDTPLGDFLRDAGFPPTEERTRLLAEVATTMLNLPRHLGQHSGGMVLCAGRLDEVVPLEPASMPGRVVVQWDKDDCADLGIVKVDLLGLGMLAVLEDAVPMVRSTEGVQLDYARLPVDDPKVYAMLRKADTVGVFQVESRAQMATLPRMQPDHFYDLVVEVAIIRPGPIVGKMVNPYLARRAGREEVTYPHPSLEPILKRTLGVPLFQEQLIRLAMVGAGFTGGQAEELRRAMGFKRSAERMRELERDLRSGMTRKGIVGEAQEQLVGGIKSFALYGFPESHAASFALIAYASAYLKAHHGAAFLAALMNNWPMGFYHPATLVSDAARHGIVTLPVDVTRSQWLCTLERLDEVPAQTPGTQLPDWPAPRPGDLGMRLGLKFVAGLREVVGKRIAGARAERPYHSITDLHARAQPNEGEARTLAEVGALAAFGSDRRGALWQVEAMGRSGALFARPGTTRSPGDSPDENVSPLPAMTLDEEMLTNIRGTRVTTGAHPVSFLRKVLEKMAVTTSAALAHKRDGERVRIGGLVVVRQRPGTAKGVVFVTLEDETGFTNALIYPGVFARWRPIILRNPMLVIGGRVQNRDGVVTLTADHFAPLVGHALGDESGISRDFH